MPEESPTAEQLVQMIQSGELLAADSTLEGREGIAEIAELLQGNVTPDFVTIMHSEAAAQEYQGIEGLRDALNDWITPYDEFKLVIDRAIVHDDKLVFLVRQVAKTKHAGVEVETPSASVWWLRDGQVAQSVFYLDQQSGLKAAGLDPSKLPEA